MLLWLQELLHRTDQLYNMASVISITLQDEDMSSQKTVEYITQLECENKHLRELLQFTQSGAFDSTIDSTTTTPLSSHPPTAGVGGTNARPESLKTTNTPQQQQQEEEVGTEDGVYVHIDTPLNSGQTTPTVTTPTKSDEAVLTGEPNN